MIIVRTVIFFLHLLVLLLLFGAVINAYIPPQWLGVLNLLSLVFPILLAFHLVFSIFWLLNFRKRGVVFLLGWVFLLPLVQRWVNYASFKNNAPELKVLTYNSKGVSKEKSAFLDNQEVDVLMLQESGWGNRIKMNLSNFRYQVYGGVVSIYSKYPIINHKKISLVENGYAIYADIRIKDKLVRFINIYLEPFRLEKTMIKPSIDAETNERKAKFLISRLIPVFKIHQTQIEEIRKYIDNSPYSVVLAGDFNSVPNSYEYYTLSKNLKDAFVEVGKGSATSFHDYKLPMRIDYIFSTPDILPISYKVNRKVELSDHYPVYSEFYFGH